MAKLLNMQADDSGGVSQLVNPLEEQYDQEIQRHQELEASPLLGPDGEVPSADKTDAEFKKSFISQPLHPVGNSSSLDDETETPTNTDSSATTPKDIDIRSEDPESSSTDDKSAKLPAGDTTE